MKLTSKQLRKIISETVRSRISESPHRVPGQQESYPPPPAVQGSQDQITPEIEEAVMILAQLVAETVEPDDHVAMDGLVTEVHNEIMNAVGQFI